MKKLASGSGVLLVLVSAFFAAPLVGCGDDDSGDDGGTGGSSATGGNSSGTGGNSSGSGGSGSGTGGSTPGAGGSGTNYVPTDPDTGPAAGTDGGCEVPAEAALEDVSNPDHVIGDGTPESCTSAAVIENIAKGGIITFDCGPDPITIELDDTAKIVNDTGPKIVIDGGGKVTLSGKGEHRILYMNTCDEAQKFTTSHCDNQDHPQLAIQNLTFVDGFHPGTTLLDGGGAVFAQGGRTKIINSRFFNNRCAETGADVGGGAVRAFQQFDGKPLYVVHSTFGGKDGLGNECSSGGGLNSINVSYTVINSLFSYNHAIGGPPAGNGAEGGDGGAISNDGNSYTLTLCGTTIENNTAKAGGGGVFYVSNDRSGHMIIDRSTLTNNTSDGFETEGFPGIFVQAAEDPTVIDSTIE